MPLLMSSRLGSFFGTSGKLSRRRWPLPSKKVRYLSRSSFKPVHCIVLISPRVSASSSGRSFYGRLTKTKTALIPKRDEGCLKSSVVPPKLQKCRRGAPAALCAVTLRSVRFVSPEAPGWRKKCSAETPFSQGRSLWAAAHILLAPSLPFAIITIHAQRACRSFAFISDYSIVRPFVNGFSQKSRVTAPRCGGYC